MKRFSQSPRDPEFVQDPYPFYDCVRAAGPLVFWEEYGFACAAGHAEVSALLRDRRFGREPPADLKPVRPAHLANFYAVDDRSMLDREPPAHTRLRRLVLRAFTSRAVAELAPGISDLADQLISDLGPGEFDLLPAFAEPLPVITIARLLGLPDAMAPQLLAWSHAMVAIYEARRDRATESAADDAAAAFATFLRSEIATRRTSAGHDLMSRLIEAEASGDRLSPEETVATCILLLNAGHEATVHAIGNGVKAILASELDPARLFSDAETTAATVEEVLRFDPPLHLFTRMALEDVEIFGHRFHRGETVGCLLAAANRDPRAYAAPARFDPDRFKAGAHTPAQLAFGAGIHFCVGAPLARMELAIALPKLFRMRDLTLVLAPVYADRYHFRGLTALRLHHRQSAD